MVVLVLVLQMIIKKKLNKVQMNIKSHRDHWLVVLLEDLHLSIIMIVIKLKKLIMISSIATLNKHLLLLNTSQLKNIMKVTARKMNKLMEQHQLT